MGSATESSLLTRIQSATDFTDIGDHFSQYLYQLKPHLEANKKPSSSKSSKTLDVSAIRPLAKQLVPFLNKSLSLIPRRLNSEAESPDRITLNAARELFHVYRLCLSCLELMSSQLDCKPYSVQIQWARFIHCLEAWSLYKEAETDAFLVLEKLKTIVCKTGGKSGTLKTQLVPKLNKDNGDQEFAFLVVEIVVTLVKCAFMNQSKDPVTYERVLALVSEAMPWFKFLNTKDYEKTHTRLVSYLSKIAQFLVDELACFDHDLVLKFCELTFSEYGKSSIQDQMYKSALRICSRVFSHINSQSFNNIDIIKCMLSSAAVGCKVEVESNATEFLELVHYCTNKCCTVTPAVSWAVAEHLSNLGGSQVTSPVGSITRLYTTGLFIFSFIAQPRNGESKANRHAKDASGSGFFLDNENVLQQLPASLKFLKDFFSNGGNRDLLAEKGTAYLLSYYNALKFLCWPLAGLIYAERKEILGERDGASFIINLGITQDAFHQFRYLVLHCHSEAGKGNAVKENASDDIKTISRVALAAFTISLRTGHHIKESANLMNHFISDGWSHSISELKNLSTSLYNITAVLYKYKKVKEASKALKLSCKAYWSCLVYYCETNAFHGDLTEDASRVFLKEAKDFVHEACKKTAFLLDLLYEGSRHKINRILKVSFERWSIAEDRFKSLPPPILLIKHWVKMECKLLEEVDAEHMATTLYSLLSSSANVSKRALGILLEQELIAYKAMNSLNPRLCQKMRMEIIHTLLDKVHVSNDCPLRKSRTLIAMGGELRALGVERLDECIHHLSEAISTLSDICSGNSRCNTEAHHLMACAFCLRALCLHETIQSNSDVILLKSNFEDIQKAVNLWMRPHQCHSAAHPNTMFEDVLSLLHDNDHSDMLFEDILKLLYHVLDLLSTKGYTEIHPDICEIIIRLFKWKKLSLEEALPILWENRRLGHTFCASPINEVFISKLSEHYGELSKSVRFWINCMKPSKPLIIGFQQSFLPILAASLQGSCFQETASPIEITDDEVEFAASDLIFHVSVDEVKLVASELISCVPTSSTSVYHSAYLYYDLSDRLILKGKLIEALSCAEEAHRLRTELLHEKFRVSVDKHIKYNRETGNGTRNRGYGLSTFYIHDRVALGAWGLCPISDFKGCTLTPWNVLQCYLESVLQVGFIQEMLGNGDEAETFLSWGKMIALHQRLPLYVIYFSLLLGKLYRKQMLWELAEEELEGASQLLADNCNMISCLKCRMHLEVSIYQQLGDLFKTRSCSSTGNPSIEMLSHAGEMYRSALDKLNLYEWKISLYSFEEASSEQAENKAQSCFFNCSMDHLNTRKIPPEAGNPETKSRQRRYRKTNNDHIPSSTNGLVAGHHLRATRSRSRSMNKTCETSSGNAQSHPTINSSNDQLFAQIYDPRQRRHASESNSFLADSACEIRRLRNKMKCWHCLSLQVLKSVSLIDLLHMKWELVWRRLSLMLLISIGKCVANVDDSHRAHEIFLLSISVLINPFCPKYSSLSSSSLIDLIEKDIPQDILSIEYAVLLYSICRIALKGYSCKFTRENGCQFSCIGIPRIFSWLKLAFKLCCEVPLLLQKVSRLLTVLCVLSTSVKAFSLPPAKVLSESHWAAFFHQASIGTPLNQQVFSSMMSEPNGKGTKDLQVDIYDFFPFQDSLSETHNSLRVAPELAEDLDEFVVRFFQRLPCSTIMCISMLGGPDATLLRELLCCPSVRAWILLSRLHSSSQPIVILLPVDSALEESSVDEVDSYSSTSFEGRDSVKLWQCPWVSSVLDEVAPMFKVILKENYLSSSLRPREETEENITLWWSTRKRLDNCLAKLLQDLEDSLLGPWKYLLLGEWSDNKHLNSLEKKLMGDLKLKCKVDVDKDLLRVLLSSAKYASEIRECGLQLILNKGCLIGGCYDAEVKSLSVDLFNILPEKDHGLKESECLGRKPMTLVLDFDIQMLPWESLPILRNEEVYRMPSVASICATLLRCCHHQELSGDAEVFPLVDPLDSFYVLNPSGDLSRTQDEFENWFKYQNFEGKTGTAPTTDEWVGALKSHDLFLYFGHGSGVQYIPGKEIRKLRNCAATLLMGCCSGSLFTKGSYAPEGAPLLYLSAGSPVIVANLWEVTDVDIDRFGKTMLDAWLRQRSSGCAECDMLLDKFKSIKISETRGNGKEKRVRSKLGNTSISSLSNNSCNHRPKIGSFMGQARDACRLPFLIGASPVCYGVPTVITNKKGL